MTVRGSCCFLGANRRPSIEGWLCSEIILRGTVRLFDVVDFLLGSSAPMLLFIILVGPLITLSTMRPVAVAGFLETSP